MNRASKQACRWLAIGLMAMIGCGEGSNGADQEEEEPIKPGPPEGTGLELAAKGFHDDPYAVGPHWYDYDGMTHTVTPTQQIYWVRRGEDRALLEILSYYDARGESGTITLRGQAAGEGAAQWSAPTEITFSASVKEQPVCLQLAPLEEVDCEDDGAAVVFRTGRRALPAAGFAVAEPAMHVRSHLASARPLVDLGYFEEVATLEEVVQSPAEIDELKPRPSSAAHPSHGLVGWIHEGPGEPPRQDIYLQVDATMHLAQWQISALEQADGEATLTMKILCQPIAYPEQTPFDASGQAEIEVTLPTEGAYDGALFEVCNAEGQPSGEVLDRVEEPLDGLWPNTREFDLIVEHIDGRIAMRLAPGNLAWNWTRGAAEGDQTFEPVDVRQIWAEE